MGILKKTKKFFLSMRQEKKNTDNKGVTKR